MNAAPYGTVATYGSPDELLAAVRNVQAAGFTRIEAFTPFPVEGMAELVLPRPSNLPAIMLGAAASGAIFGFALQSCAARDYPLNSGGRPLFSWPSFVPVTFELAVLTAVVTGIAVFLWRAGLPHYHHPVFAAHNFGRASTDRFFLAVCADDPRYSPIAARAAFANSGPISVEEITS
ncbi:MAG: hypothetical protein JWM32_795 [Verrucomicrobia bacterium]|nr:hypothetical protein [Verrucomicrobiota bacterium]